MCIVLLNLPYLMKELALAIVAQLNSSVAVLFLVLIITCVVLYKLGYWSHKFAAHDRRVEHIEGLAEKVVSLTTKVDLIYQFVNPHSPVKAASPISLTPSGKAIAENINAASIISKYGESFCTEVEKMPAKTAYDIQQASMEFARHRMLNMLNEDELVKVKQEAFNRGIPLEDVMSVFGVLLRNHILEKKGIPIAAVDEQSPKPANG